jgi:hypothetical protein
MKSQDILDKIHKPEPKTLADVWVQTLSEIQGQYVPPLVKVDCVKLRHFGKACPEGKAFAILEFNLRHWSTFIQTVKAHAGDHTVPVSPHVGFLLKHVALAVMDWQNEQAPVQTIAQAPKPRPKAGRARNPGHPRQVETVTLRRARG